MRKLITALLVSFLLCSCSALDAVSLISPSKPSIEVNANVGKNVEQEKSNVKIEQGGSEVKQDAETISNDTAYTAKSIQQITQNIPIEFLLIAVLLGGWAIPTPKETYHGIKVVISDVFSTLLVKPFKGSAEFVLRLFGR